MRKALCIGINSYVNLKNLYGCVNDALAVNKLLERNGDGTKNFNTKIICASDEDTQITRTELKDLIIELFESDSEIAVLYYAGHGSYDELGGYLCTSEVKRSDDGLSLDDIMGIVAQSKALNKVIILDSCHSGSAGTSKTMNNFSVLHSGTTILAACDEKQYASESNGHGVFTKSLIEALNGGSMNLLGEVSPGSIYAYIDRSLGEWGQRPIFKANIKRFVSLRRNVPPITTTELRLIKDYFCNPDYEYPLNPTYEPDKHEVDNKEINKENEYIFSLLQKFVKLNLVTPVGSEHMYYAAIGNKGCKLTAQGQYYWELAMKDII